MDAVAIISRVGNEWRYVVISTVTDPEQVGQILKEHYTTLDKVVKLLDKGNIITLKPTIAGTSFSGSLYKTIEAVHNQPDDFDVANYNYVFAMDREGNRFWVMTRMGIDGFHNI